MPVPLRNIQFDDQVVPPLSPEDAIASLSPCFSENEVMQKMFHSNYPILCEIIASFYGPVLGQIIKPISTKQVSQTISHHKEKLLERRIFTIMAGTAITHLASTHSDHKAAMCDASVFQSDPRYTRLSKYPPSEQEALAKFLSYVRIALSIFPGKANKELILNIARRLECGRSCITGTRHGPQVVDRVLIYEVESGVTIRTRCRGASRSTVRSKNGRAVKANLQARAPKSKAGIKRKKKSSEEAAAVVSVTAKATEGGMDFALDLDGLDIIETYCGDFAGLRANSLSAKAI